MAYYEVARPGPGEIQQDVWQDHTNEGDEEEYASPGVRNLRAKFLSPRDSGHSPRSLGSSRAPPPRAMTPPRDYDGVDVRDGANIAGIEETPPQPQISVKSTARPRRTSGGPQPQRQVSGGSYSPPHPQGQISGDAYSPPQPQARSQARPQPASPRTSSNYQSSITVQPTTSYAQPPQSSLAQYNMSPVQQTYRPIKTLQSVDNEDTGECRVVHLQYNSPLQLYSTDNASHTLEAQTKGAPGYGTLMVKGVPQEFDPGNSYVLQAIHDDEHRKTTTTRVSSSKQTIRLVQPTYGSDF